MVARLFFMSDVSRLTEIHPRLPPAPRPMRLVGWRGNALRFFTNPVATMTRLRSLGTVARLIDTPHPSLFHESTPEAATVFAFGAECNRAVLTDLDTFQTRRPRGPRSPAFDRLSENLLFMNGDRHKRHRRLLTPLFQRDALRRYQPTLIASTRRMLDTWSDGRAIDLDGEMSRLTLDIASRTFFGLSPDDESGRLALLMRDAILGLFAPTSLLRVDLPGSPYRRLIGRFASIERELLRTIERKRTQAADDPEAPTDILTTLIRAHDAEGPALTDAELVSHAFVIFFAGHDTSAAALCWTLLLLALHPDVRADLEDELRGSIDVDAPDYGQLNRLPMLDRVIKESLRLLPPAVMFPRVASRDTQLAGYDIPAATDVLYSPYVSHRDPAHFSHPQMFDPSRWEHTQPPPFAFLPFGHGARLCLGAAFANNQLRTLVAMIVGHGWLEIPSGSSIDIDVHVVMRARRGVPAIVHTQRGPGSPPPRIGGFLRTMVDLP